MTRHPAFKAYDLRGRVGREIDEGFVRRVARAFARVVGARAVVLGRDARASSAALTDAAAEGLMDEGADVLDLGLCGTEEVYFGAFHLAGVGGGLMVTASHNPSEWNGLKLVREEARPIAWETGLSAVHDLALGDGLGSPAGRRGLRRAVDLRPPYARAVAAFLDPAGCGPLRVLVNAGNGAAGPTFDAVVAALGALPWEFVRMDWAPDPAFPHGVPNPLIPDNRTRTAQAVVAARADLGVAWDGDFDRCFFFDEGGRFVDGEHVVALLARAALAREPGARIVHEPRVVWAVEDAVRGAGGVPVLSRTGHAHLKAALRSTGAPYGGELSAHHYFRDFGFCDSGMIPWLLIAGLVARERRPLSALVGEMRARFPSSGEVNFEGLDHAAAVARFEAAYLAGARGVDRTDGVSLDLGSWRANVRVSNTEGLLRLNVESRGDRGLVAAKVEEIGAILRGTA